jgi:hypothetical protein
MAITKSNKHKLSLDHDKPNEKGGCTLATLYALMKLLILILKSWTSFNVALALPCTQSVSLAEQTGKSAGVEEVGLYL